MLITRTLTISEAARAISSGALTAERLVASCLETVKSRDGQIHALLALMEREALEEARLCDAETAAGRSRGPLHGILLTVKDNIDVQGMPTTVASPLFAHAPPARVDAPVVAKLRKAGAIILGKNNMDELAAHISGRSSCFGPCCNPWQLEKKLSPGGSSSGTAAAVAAGFCLGGLGTDTGGSIRVPSGWCGLCGIRPTYGQISMERIYPRAKSLDVAGPIGRSPQDVALLLRIIAKAPLAKALAASCAPVFSDLRIGIFPNIFRLLSPDVKTVYSRVVSRCEDLGAHCVPVDLAVLDDPGVAETVNSIRAFEFARDIAADMEHNAGAARVHPAPQADYQRGKSISRASYEEALRQKSSLSAQLTGLFQQTAVQAFLLPTALFTAPSCDADLDVFVTARCLVNLFSLTGNPSVVFRGGLAADGLPVGMQLVGASLSDGLLLGIADAYEQAYGGFLSPWGLWDTEA